MVQNNQESKRKYWATRSSIRSFARTAHSSAGYALPASLTRSAALHSFARSVTSLTPLLVGQRMIGWLSILSFFLFWTLVQCYHFHPFLSSGKCNLFVIIVIIVILFCHQGKVISLEATLISKIPLISSLLVMYEVSFQMRKAFR